MEQGVPRKEWIEAALERHESALLRYALSLTGDIELAKDIVQDTFLRLCEQPIELSESRLAPWLFTVCRNRAIDCQRKETRMTRVEPAELEAHPRMEPAPDEDAAIHDMSRRLLALVESLPGNQREVVRLRFHGQMSYQEISDITQLSVTNVGFLLHSALKTLRVHLAVLDRTSAIPSSNPPK
jgi:RNA polymerase sigma factor (sigma-70 family)